MKKGRVWERLKPYVFRVKICLFSGKPIYKFRSVFTRVCRDFFDFRVTNQKTIPLTKHTDINNFDRLKKFFTNESKHVRYKNRKLNNAAAR